MSRSNTPSPSSHRHSTSPIPPPLLRSSSPNSISSHKSNGYYSEYNNNLRKSSVRKDDDANDRWSVRSNSPLSQPRKHSKSLLGSPSSSYSSSSTNQSRSLSRSAHHHPSREFIMSEIEPYKSLNVTRNSIIRTHVSVFFISVVDYIPSTFHYMI